MAQVSCAHQLHITQTDRGKKDEMSDMYQDVYIETTTGSVQGPFETVNSSNPLEIWIYDDLAEIQVGYVLFKNVKHGTERYHITAIREDRTHSSDGRRGALRRCLTVRHEDEHLVNALSNLIQKINASQVPADKKAEAKSCLSNLVSLPLVAAILNGSGKTLLDKLSQ